MGSAGAGRQAAAVCILIMQKGIAYTSQLDLQMKIRVKRRTSPPWRAPFAFMARTILTVSLLAAAAAQITMPAPFSAGTLSVLRVGSGTAPIAPLQHLQVDIVEIQ